MLPAELAAINQTAVDYPRDRTIAQLFEEQVARTPEKIALIAGDIRLSYRQLDARSNQLAHRLRKLGVKPDSLVGVATERSEHMLISILAILKAGGAYVPLDPDYPGARVAAMVEDSGLATILTTKISQPKLPTTSAAILVLDNESEKISAESSLPVLSAATSSNLAYVIYTSGSTGKPKGVMIEHRNVVNFFAGMDLLIGTEPGVWLAVTSMAFDISVLELLWTLMRGFTVVLHFHDDPRFVAREIREHGVTHLQSTPSLARILAMDADVLAALSLLKTLLLGGEALPPALVSQIRTVFSGDFLNMYGPTETTIWSTAYRIGEFGNNVPVGLPIANTSIYILDHDLRPLAFGEAGGLYIGGEGVVRGYLGKPELTAERFLPDPFSPGTRMYWTGDVARFLPGGNIEFLGRMDHQVKIRGFRIELGEIESVLEESPEVHQAVVVAREDKPGDIRLVAYVVPASGGSPKPDALRSSARAKLPEFMVPSQYVFLESLPLTANGKIDRKALPAPTPIAEIAQTVSLPTHTDLEAILVDLWSDALGIPLVSLQANFFDLGAHSLLVAEVHSRLQEKLGREISLVDLFEFPTVASLAQHLGGAQYAVPAPFSARAQRRREARSMRSE